MLLLTALGSLAQIRAAADELDRHDPSPADAVTWFEEAPSGSRIEIFAPTEQDAASVEAIVGAAAPELHLVHKDVPAADWVAMALDGCLRCAQGVSLSPARTRSRTSIPGAPKSGSKRVKPSAPATTARRGDA